MKKTHLLLTALMCALTFLSARAQSTSYAEEVVVEVATEVEMTEYPNESEDTSLENVICSPIDLSQVPVVSTFHHDDFTLNLPTEFTVRNKLGLESITCWGTGYELTAVVCPIGIEEKTYPGICEDLRVFPLLDTAKEVNISGLEMKAYKVRHMYKESESNYHVLYAFNSGEKTYFFLQSSDIPSDWLTSHINWKIKGKSEKSANQRLNAFAKFFRNIIQEDGGRDMLLTEEGNCIHLTVKNEFDRLPMYKAAETIFLFVNALTIFREYADMGYDFTLTSYDDKGTLLDEFTFTQEQYSTWTDREELLKFLDNNLPEGTHELEHRAIGG